MLMSTFEYKTLFGDKNPNEISAEEIEEKKKEKNILIQYHNQINLIILQHLKNQELLLMIMEKQLLKLLNILALKWIIDFD